MISVGSFDQLYPSLIHSHMSSIHSELKVQYIDLKRIGEHLAFCREETLRNENGEDLLKLRFRWDKTKTYVLMHKEKDGLYHFGKDVCSMCGSDTEIEVAVDGEEIPLKLCADCLEVKRLQYKFKVIVMKPA